MSETKTNLLPEEAFALRQALGAEPALRDFIAKSLEDASVTRERTGVGFFATVTFSRQLPPTEAEQWDWNFSHLAMPNGGSFICWKESSTAIGLEAVSHEGDWPATFRSDEFTSLD